MANKTGYSLLAKTENELAKYELAEANAGKPEPQPAVPAGQNNLGHMSDKDRAAAMAARAAMASAMTGECRDAEDRIACIRNAGGKKPQGQSK